jgi:hypothetical protein
MCIFIDPSIEDIVWSIRSRENTNIVYHTKDQFGGSFFPFFDKVQSIRTSEAWLSQVGWLRDSTQATMEYYNPMVMSKMFLLHNAKIFNFFNTDYLFWIDGGITNTVHPGYFTHDKVIEKVQDFVKKYYSSEQDLPSLNNGLRLMNANEKIWFGEFGIFNLNIKNIQNSIIELTNYIDNQDQKKILDTMMQKIFTKILSTGI